MDIGALREAHLPKGIARALKIEVINASDIPISETVATEPPSTLPSELGAAMDVDPKSAPHPKQIRARKARPEPKTGLIPYVEVTRLSPMKAGKKRARADSEVEVKETGKGKKEQEAKSEELSNIKLDDGTVVIRWDDPSIPTVDLTGVKVTEMDVVDLDAVPILVNKVSFRASLFSSFCEHRSLDLQLLLSA